jgi:hypothetical protein
MRTKIATNGQENCYLKMPQMFDFKSDEGREEMTNPMTFRKLLLIPPTFVEVKPDKEF